MPRRTSPEARREHTRAFELPPLRERMQYPFIAFDPAKPEKRLDAPIGARMLMSRFVDDGPEYLRELPIPEGLPLILHMTLHGRNRAHVSQWLNHMKTERSEMQHGRFVELNRVPWAMFEHTQPLKGLKILDYGSAEQGVLTRALRALGAEAHGIDFNDGPVYHDDRDHPRSFAIQSASGPLTVLGRNRMDDPAVRQKLQDIDIVYSGKLMRTVAPDQHKHALEEWFIPLMKPGALLITVPKLAERLDTLYPQEFGTQFDQEPETYFDSYTIARKRKTPLARTKK